MADYETRYAWPNSATSLPRPAALAISPGQPRTEQRIRIGRRNPSRVHALSQRSPSQGPVKGTSSFASDFQRLWPSRHGGQIPCARFDLHKRLFRYPCSFLIYSEQFDGLPPEMKITCGAVSPKSLMAMTPVRPTPPRHPDDRRATFEICANQAEFDSWIRRAET